MRASIDFLLPGLVAISLSCTGLRGQRYETNWESLDQRPVAGWFQDAKLGIFIHWGPYSVPAFTPKGTYSEWYQYWLQNKTLFGNGQFKGDEVYEYHRRTYGEDFPYYRFGELFTADLFDPKQWAALFARSGARYVVITTKHHDGYCLWPSEQANDRGFPWNSVAVGAERDLIGELTPAVKAAGLKMGFYYSLYEWFHPWWQEDRERFVTEHFHPQFKDLVERYQPDILWGDGEWDMPAEDWKTPELLAWLFNESSVRDSVVINDRWGKGIRQKHGGYFTTEYEASAEYSRPWEECRGMGFSFGYNHNEDIEDYNSPQTLILMLVDIVSHGGNLLLDIGPDHRGKIPVIMQERLLQIGRWLETNGEAIYGTRPWKRSEQWSEGRRDYKPEGQHYLGGDYVLKLTVDPEPGYAAKELYFTRKEDNLYAISPLWPGKSMIIRDVNLPSDCRITWLGTDQALSWRQRGPDVEVTMPLFDPNALQPTDHAAYVFRLEGAM
jgi:alpha-L-fucosidase